MQEKKDWTVMIYMAGDNNLSADMSYALEELQRKVALKEDASINLFVYYQNNSPEIPALYCDFSDSNKPEYHYGTEVARAPQSTDAPDAEGIAPTVDFVDWCVNRVEHKLGDDVVKGRKAENYALIFAGHTMGFLSMGLLKDESSDVSITMPAMQKGLGVIKNEVIGKKIALLGFDSCVMGMYEVGMQFTEVAETMIASEGSIPNAGWSYPEILGCLANSEPDIRKITKDCVKSYIEKQSRYSIGGVSVDMAAWDLSKLDGLNKTFEAFAQLLLDCFDDETSVIYRRMRHLILQVHYNCQTYMSDQSVDLGDFCSLLLEELALLNDEVGSSPEAIIGELYESCKSVIVEIELCVVLSGFSGGSYQHSTGVSLFFPWSLSAYGVSQYDYEQLSFVKNTNSGRVWNSFLQKYLGEVTLRKGKDPTAEDLFKTNQTLKVQKQSVR